jgi:DNA-binding PadR family transcriptional regulator
VDVPRVEVVVLGLLAEEPMHGYDLWERYRARGMDGWASVGRASVYQALHRMERQGLISGRAQRGALGPGRRVYRITRPGRDRLRAGLLERFGLGRGEGGESAVALGLAHLLPAEAARHGIAARERAIAARLEALGRHRAGLQGTGGAGNTVARRMLDLEEEGLRGEAAWLASLRRDLSRLRRWGQPGRH